MANQRNVAQKLLDLADIKIGGSRPWDIKVYNKNFYKKVFSQGSLGLGESYMQGYWDCEKLDEFFNKVFSAGLERRVIIKWNLVFHLLKSRIFNLQKKSEAFTIGKRHYDIGNNLYQVMLDKRMVYSCGYWKKAKNLDQAQEAKLDLICRKLGLKPGMKILDIGCGWGSFVKYTAEKYKVEVVGITVSKEQAKFARKLCKGLPVEIRLQDYRDIKERFDRIVSVGMFEHVGYKNYNKYMKVVYKCLNKDGLFLLQTIGSNNSITFSEPWISKYIFPNGMLPSIKQIAYASEGLLVMEDLHNFGPDYDKTTIAWYKNFHKNWDKVKSDYSKNFYRMWEYYLLLSAGAFRSRKFQLWQIVFSKKDVAKVYKSVR